MGVRSVRNVTSACVRWKTTGSCEEPSQNRSMRTNPTVDLQVGVEREYQPWGAEPTMWGRTQGHPSLVILSTPIDRIERSTASRRKWSPVTETYVVNDNLRNRCPQRA